MKTKTLPEHIMGTYVYLRIVMGVLAILFRGLSVTRVDQSGEQ
jgi:hypothetical protein